MSVSGQLKLCKNGWAHLSVQEAGPPPWPLHRNTTKRVLSDEVAADVAVLRRLVSLNLVAPAEARRRASHERLNAFGLLRALPSF